MRIPRIVVVFFCAAGAVLALAILKALLVSGLDTLPPAKILIFASSTFGMIAALIDWGVLRDLMGSRRISPQAENTKSAASHAFQAGFPIVGTARLRPIVFREICPPPEAAGLSFYGGIPMGPASFAWPRTRNKPGEVPLSFLMQWECGELARQDTTGLLPRDGVLYLFCDLNWGDPFDFQFVHAAGPVNAWQVLPLPPGLPAIYGNDGAYQVPFCSPLVAKDIQRVPQLLPKWPFTPIAFSYPAEPQSGEAQEPLFWNDGETVGNALLLVEHPEGVPPAKRRDDQQKDFRRPFHAFPHDYAAVRIVAARVLDQMRRPASWLLPDASKEEREVKFQAWREETAQHYASAAAHQPAARLEQSQSDDIWNWMERLEPVLSPGWRSIVDECVNVSLGLASEATGTLPAGLVATCAESHTLASAYLRDEYPDWTNPDAQAKWEVRRAEGSLQQIRSVHAPCPNHMFGPPSYVQGSAEEYLNDWLLLLELSSRDPIGHKFGEGVLQFLIRPADLQERRFDKVVLIASAY